MITELTLHGFKGWDHIERMRLAPITGLFGANSSGKTSILQFLLMLKQTAESADRAQPLFFGDEKSPANLGTYLDIVHGHSGDASVSWRVAWNRKEQLTVRDPQNPRKTLLRGNDFAFEAHVEGDDGKLRTPRMAYDFAGHRFALRHLSRKTGKYELADEHGEFAFNRNVGRPWELPGPVKCYGYPDQVKTYFQNAGFLADLELAFEKLWSHVYYLGPLREYPKRQYSWAGAEPADMGMRGEQVVAALLAAQRNGAKISMDKGVKRRSLEEHVAHWLKDLGLIHSFTVDRIARDTDLYRVKVRKTARSPEVLITDVGFGVSQILPVLVICYYVPEGSTVILEQPEIHLHPMVQAGLGNVFVDAAKRRGIQIVFESHSEHLLRRLQRLVAEENTPADDVALYFCDIVGGASELRPLELDMFGTILNWPKDFFGDEFAEMSAINKAVMRRKKRARS